MILMTTRSIRFRTILQTICFLVIGLQLQAQKQPDFTVKKDHPRLLLLKGEEKQIREKIAGDAFLASMHHYIIRTADSILNEPVVAYELIGSQLLKVSRKALTYIYYLSYSWRMTGDDRYAARAKKELLNVAAFKSWNPTHFLDVAEMVTAVSIGYDWLYSYLDNGTKERLRKAIIRKGLYESLPEKATDKSHYSWLKKKNNWNSVCNTGMALGAITIYESDPELAKKIIGRSIKLVRDVALEEYLPDGNYPEGYSYWRYGTTYNITLIDALEKLYGSSFGLMNNKGFMKTPEYILQMSTQNSGCFAYADCFADQSLSYPMLWFANRTGDPGILWTEAERLNNARKMGMTDAELFDVRYLPSALLWAPANPFSGVKKPEKRQYIGRGTTPIAIMRNHWGGDDEIFLAMKGGRCVTNHSHMDIGSFVMYRGKNRWVTDLGGQPYYSLEKYGFHLGDRSQYSRRWDALRIGTKTHNIITFDGDRQNVTAKAEMDEQGERTNFMYAISNLSAIDSPHVARRNRGVAIVDNNYVVIRDEIVNAEKFTDIRWAMLTPASVKLTGRNEAELEMNGEKMRMKVVGEGITMNTWSTKPEFSFDEDNGNTIMVGFTSVLQPGQSVAYTVYLIPEGAQTKNEKIRPLKDWKTIK
ncbi:heparinase II/III domain-containing protein [Niabella hirudinis]|uniref:heparinase II/III domain-containing protein n=1 Tax=Niabella hirudinis TaxID=1285929 RepID=UPI003EC10EA5